MNKCVIVLVGMFAVANASLQLAPLTPFDRSHLTEWNVYKVFVWHFFVSFQIINFLIKFLCHLQLRDLKQYLNPAEDRFRRNIYFANKGKVHFYGLLVRYGLSAEKFDLDIFADCTFDELLNLRKGIEVVPVSVQSEWESYKLRYSKIYDAFEDQFRRTIFFIVKDIVAANEKLYERGFSTVKMVIDVHSDLCLDELESGSPYIQSSASTALSTRHLSYSQYRNVLKLWSAINAQLASAKKPLVEPNTRFSYDI